MAAFPHQEITVRLVMVGEDGGPLKATDAFVQQLADKVIETIMRRESRGQPMPWSRR